MKLLALIAFAATALASAASAQDRMPAENWTKPYNASPTAVPACESPDVLSTIQSRFAETESEYWASPLTIVAIDSVRPVAFRPWGLDYIPRRFCSGVATTSDGKRRNVQYSVIEDAGIIGWGWGVQWCVAGLDRQLAYAPGCKQAAP
jgi:hypothetical protein